MTLLMKRTAMVLGVVLFPGILLATGLAAGSLEFPQPVNAQADQRPIDSETIRQILSKVVEDGKVPGVMAAVISSRGLVASGAAGVRKSGSDSLLTPRDKVHLGSCTKAMTCAMLATLVTEGRLDWDMTLTEVIPELKRAIHPDFHDITLWELLTHRAAVEDCFTFDRKLTKEKRLDLVKDRLSAPSGLRRGEFSYSNLGYVAAACMAERVSGLLWEDLMETRLFQPLGMTSAGFGAPGPPGQIDQPWGHQRSWRGWRPDQTDCSEALSPAGRVHCSLDDWAAFLALFLTPQNSFLNAPVMAKLVTPVGYYAGGWGVTESQPWAKGVAYSHNGSNARWFASVVLAPALDRAYVVVTNSRDFGVTGDACRDMVNSLIKADLGIGED